MAPTSSSMEDVDSFSSGSESILMSFFPLCLVDVLFVIGGDCWG